MVKGVFTDSMSYLGIDHGTSAVRFYLLPENISFEIPRGEKDFSVIEELSKRIEIKNIELAGVTYSMGDSINKITLAEKVHGRGVVEESTGSYIGTGTRVYDEIVENFKTIVIPGLHRNTEVLDERFRALYSHMASSEKVSLSYDAYLRVNAENIIISDIGSNTVTIAIKNSKFFGALDACIGAIGLEHGPLDLEAIRSIDRGEITANEAFYNSGAKKIYNFKDASEILNPGSERAELALRTLIMSVKMEIFSFLAEVEPQAFVITGRGGESEIIFSSLKKSLEKIAPVIKLDKWSAARGSAEIARDVAEGKREILGIEVEL